MTDATRPPRQTTSRDIARRAGVSQTTVSRVLQDSPHVSAAVRERVRRAMAEANYRPNAMARAMKTQRSGTIGVLVARITNPFYPQLLDQLARAIAARGHRAVVWDADTHGEQPAFDALQEGVIDGLVHGAATEVTPALRHLLDIRAPLVFVNRRVAPDDCEQVVTDNQRGAHAMVDYLLRHARRRIALIGGPPAISVFREREAFFIERLQTHGARLALPVQRVPVVSYHSGLAAMRALLASPAPPDTVFCVNDTLALGAVDAARETGVPVPRRLWVAGYDDVDMASWRAFDLTTVRQPMAEMASLTVGLLLDRLRDPAHRGRVHRLPGELVVRGSTGGAPAS